MRYPVRAYLYARWSSHEQRKGNSLARQSEWAADWCKRKGISLDETLTFTDSGVSGHHGKNHKTGALSLFIKACQQGRIARGSFLIVENLDRLSRENPLDALDLVRTLLKTYGIVLVTIHPAMELSAANLGMVEGVLMFIEFGRGHSESAAKSTRSKDNWNRKRASLKDGAVITAKVFFWLKVVGGKLVVNEPKAEIVRRIFGWSAQGFGHQAITKKLNAEKVPPPTKHARLWHDSYIQKLLSCRSVLGEYQPMTLKDGVRVAAGELMPNYYPQVITPAVWERSRNAMASRRLHRGRITKRVSNLFTKLVFQDGEQCAYRSKKMIGYLQPASKTTPGIRYDQFERAVLWWVADVSVNLNQTDSYDDAKRHADQLATSIKQLQTQIDADPSMVDMLPTLSKWRKQHKEAVDRMEACVVPLQSHYLHSKRLVDAIKTTTGDDLETLRREIRLALHQVVARIDIVTTRKKGERKVMLCVRLRDGQSHLIGYKVFNGRVVSGFHAKRDANNITISTDYPEDDTFPVDPEPVSDIKAKCRQMREDGASYKEITAATGLHRVSIYRYVKDYQRSPK